MTETEYAKETSREKIIERMKGINKELLEILVDIAFENIDGKQFDYVNSYQLADATTSIHNIILNINHIVFQCEDDDNEYDSKFE